MANRYWVGGTGTWDTTSTTNWSASSGGASGASVPTAADSVFFDQAGTYTVTMTGALTCLDITVSAGTVAFAVGTTPTLAISGSMTLLAGGTWGNIAITFNATTTGKTLTTNGVSLRAVTFDGIGGGWTLGSALTCNASSTITLTNGNFDASTYNVSCGRFASNNSNTRTLSLGSGTWALGNNGAKWSTATTTNLTFNKNSANFLLTESGASGACSFSGGGLTYNKLTLNNTLSSGPLTINGGNTFSEIASTATVAATIQCASGTTTTVSAWSASGTSGKLLTIRSDTSGTQATIALTGGGTVSTDYLSVRDIVFTPGPATDGTTPYVWYLGANSTNSGNNTGGLFQSGEGTPIKVYQITNTATTSWTVPSDWNSASNTIHLIGGATSAVSGNNRAAGGGGGGGGYTVVSNFSTTPASSITVAVGTAGAADGDGGNTGWNAGAYVANGGKKGTAATTPTSAGGAGGTGTYAGGQGGAGAFGTTASQGYGSGGGGGAGGPNGIGGAGGTGFGSTTAANVAGGGGGGNGGGSAGGNAASATFGAGGNNFGATGGGATAGAAGTFGGGGAGNVNVSAGGSGGSGIDIVNTVGGAGGKGGGGAVAATANTGLYGGGGPGGGVATAGTTYAGGAGSQGIIIIAYTPSAASTSNFLFFFPIQ